jgi:hypothetical protein
MDVWTFQDFVDAGGRNVIRDWMDGLPPDAQAAIDDRLIRMATMRKEDWSDKWVSKYQGLSGIFELRMPHNKIQYRPLGCYGPGRMRFTLLVGTIEKGGKIPKSDLCKAEERHEIVFENPTRHVCKHFD